MVGPTPSALGELAQAEPVRADALDQLGGGGDDRRLGQAGAGAIGAAGALQRSSSWSRIFKISAIAAASYYSPGPSYQLGQARYQAPLAGKIKKTSTC